MNAYFYAMKHSFNFKGRATRSQFWTFTLVSIIIALVAVGIDLSTSPTASDLGPVASLVTLIHLIPSLSITVRRLHDIGRGGWWILVGLVPLIGTIVLLVFVCTGSKTENNNFDPNMGDANAIREPQVNPSRTTNSLDEIEKVASLRSSGAISEEEFRELKTDILARDSR